MKVIMFIQIINEMKTVSDFRSERKFKDSLDDYNAKKNQKLKDEKICYLRKQIEEEKIAIIDCLDQNFISMAKSKIIRIGELLEEINNLK